MGTAPFHVAVGEEPLTAGAIRLGHRVLVDIVLLKQGEEDVLDDLGVISRAGTGEQIKRNTQLFHILHMFPVESIDNSLRRSFLIFSGNGNRCTMFVTP